MNSTSTTSSALNANTARSEVESYLYVHEQRRRVLPRAALAGLLAALAAVAFRAALAAGDLVRNALVAWAHAYLFGWLLPMAFGAACAALSLYLVRRFAPETAGSGIPHLEAVLRRYRPMRWRRVLPVKFLGGTLAIGGGMALGREGPTVQMGGAVGAAVAGLLRITARKPTATTTLAPYMRVTAMISPPVEKGLNLLRDGCEATGE
jgi:CIC family chloride channel protein